MNKKEIGEIKRRFKTSRTNMTAVYGCYVRANGEIISEFKSPMSAMSENESDKYMSIFRRTLGGSIGKTLNNISFATSQVANREEQYGVLADLRDCRLDDETCRRALYEKIIAALETEHNYLILLGCETFDVIAKSKNDESDGSEESFTYCICSICPVKETKPSLHYVFDESTFHDGGMMQAVSPPINGFLFPAFDDRATNLYGALYYSKDTGNINGVLLDALFGTKPPMSAEEERTSFSEVLSSALGDECCIEVVHGLQAQVSTLAEVHKSAKIPEPLTVGCTGIQEMLSDCGVSKPAREAFRKKFEETFGVGAELHLSNIMDTKHYIVSAKAAEIIVDTESTHLVRTGTVDGKRYIMVPFDDFVTVNGVQISTKT